jgi:hypothetical protein
MGFDIQQANEIFNISQSSDPVGVFLQTQYGVPDCALNLASDVLGLLPSSPLNQINKRIDEGKQRALDRIKEVKRKVLRELGILEVGTNRGVTQTLAEINDAVLGEGGQGFLEAMGTLGEMLGTAQAVWGEVVVPVLDKVDEVKACIDIIQANDALQRNNSSMAKDYINSDLSAIGLDVSALQNYSVDYDTKYASERQDIINALSFVAKAQNKQNEINKILDNRFNDPDNYPEPCFDGEVILDSGIPLKQVASGTDFCVVDATSTGYCSLGKNFNTRESCESAGGIWTDREPTPLPQESFSVKPVLLSPPISRSGKFILTDTGIYYDTVGGGLDLPDNLEELVECSSLVPETSLKYMFEYDPNCGGKGETVTLKQFNQWANTIFDLDAPMAIEEDKEIRRYYDNDVFLQQLQGERNRHLYDLSSYIGDLIASGYSSDSALVLNQNQQLQAAEARFQDKIKRRKKQIQVAVVFGDFSYGQIPINDFSFLNKSDIDISVESQTKLVFNPGEVSSVVLPISATFGISKSSKAGKVYLDHLTVPDIGTGSIISNASSVSERAVTVLSLTDNITTDDLIACYNFLQGTVELRPDSAKFNVLNSFENPDLEDAAQIVAEDFDTIYPSGVGIPYFKGICDFFSGISGGGNSKSSNYGSSSQYLQSPYRPLSYMRLPDIDDFQSLLTRLSGFTFETWIYMPTLGDSGVDGWDESANVSALHRVVMANENRGGDYSVENVEVLSPLNNLNTVKSLLMGFTRDRRFTKDLPPSNNLSDNPIEASSLKFYMAPTQSYNTSGITFVRRPGPDGRCHPEQSTGQRYVGLVVDASSIDCSSAFKLVTVTASPKDDGVVSIYSNGTLLKTQNYAETFGTKGPQLIPGAFNVSSFSYNNTFPDLPPYPVSYIPSAVYQGDFWNFKGPVVNGFTPWIIGGGYSDGMTNTEFGYSTDTDSAMNFMGSEYGGRRSGLNGFLGSVKLYKKALTQVEVENNYNAQKGFFENIEL